MLNFKAASPAAASPRQGTGEDIAQNLDHLSRFGGHGQRRGIDFLQRMGMVGAVQKMISDLPKAAA